MRASSPLRLLAALLPIGLVASCAIPSPAPVGQQFFAGGTGVRVYRSGVKSLHYQRFEHVVRQRLDFSCGAAALATLLRFYYDDPVEESEIIVSMLQTGDADRIRRSGFSLLDLKGYAESLGYQTRGYKIPPEVLEQLAIPAITLVRTRNYSHFVVLKGARDGVVYLADPALGHRALRKSEFVEEWAGVVLFVAAHREPGTESPLDRLEAVPRGPAASVRRLDQQGLRNLIFNPQEF